MSTIVEVAVQFLSYLLSLLPFIITIKILKFIIKKIIYLSKTGQYNKKICSKMVDRIRIAETAVIILKIHKEEYEDFFSEDNYNLRKLVDVMRVMKKFIEDVSLATKLNKFVQAKNIKRVFINLNKKLDSTIKILEFDFMVYFNARADNDNKKIMADIEVLFKVMC